MELFNLYEISENENIEITNFKMKNRKARIVNDYYTYIFIDYSKINSYTEEKCILAEELGHYYYQAYYSLCDDNELINKQEYKAMKWKSLACVPRQSILNCFKLNIYNLLEIAEKLQVEPNMVKFAYNYYKDNDLLSIGGVKNEIA